MYIEDFRDLLIGKVVEKIYISNDDQCFLKLVGSDFEVCLEAEGECCANCYFSEIYNADSLRGREIEGIDFVEIATKVQTEKSRQEYDDIMGIRIRLKSDRYDIDNFGKTCFIGVRNSSNGYYGGTVLVSDTPKDVEFVEFIGDVWMAD